MTAWAWRKTRWALTSRLFRPVHVFIMVKSLWDDRCELSAPAHYRNRYRWLDSAVGIGAKKALIYP
jgi:hypothetical protein